MKCPKCGSENVTVQMVTHTKIINHHHSVFWWIFIGWWWLFFKWLFLTVPALIAKLFFRRKQLKQTDVKHAICQSCGYSWTVK